mmetsp:Transcript_77477/g.217480  ORF Transcript_77477/g.217480 Transcript_77477/m.217480 type:complete len:105 (+) Transcript_77477:256-570(+)
MHEQHSARRPVSSGMTLGVAPSMKQGRQQQPQVQPPTNPQGHVCVFELMSPVTVHGQQEVRMQRPTPPGLAQHSQRPVDHFAIAGGGVEALPVNWSEHFAGACT